VQRQCRTWDLETATERVPGGIVVTPRGRISSVTAARFAEVVTSARAYAATVIIDLSGVDYISGAGVSVLGNAAHNGDRIVVCGLKDSVRITLELAQVLPELAVEDNRELAIGSLITD
jgi:anti-anti-sigma factor